MTKISADTNGRGRFITFEGIDGAGKTSQIDACEAFLREKGIRVVRTREPGGTVLGEKIRAMLRADDMVPLTETLLFFASRAEHIAQVIEPALARGDWVLSDRFTDATYAYQVGGKGIDPAVVETLEKLVQGTLQPDVTVLFDIDPVKAAERLKGAREADRFEKLSTGFFSGVRQAYLARAAASPERFCVVDAARPQTEVTAAVLKEAAAWL